MSETPMVREECDHFWVSIHKPGHILYWVKVCQFCREPDWDALDEEVRDAIKRMGNKMNGNAPGDPMTFLDRAKTLVYVYAKQHLDVTDGVKFEPEDVYIVWSCKVLGNWKAMLSTSLPDGMYYEVTHDGTACYDYVDAYKKFTNKAVPEGIDSYDGVLEFLS